MFDMNLPDHLFYSDIYFVSSRRAKVAMNEQLYYHQKNSILEEIDLMEDREDECSGSDDRMGSVYLKLRIFWIVLLSL